MIPRPHAGYNEPDDPPDPDEATVEQVLRKNTYRVWLTNEDDFVHVTNPQGLRVRVGSTVILDDAHQIILQVR